MDFKSLKTAVTENDVIDLIKRRFSPRSFSNQSLTQKEVVTLIEAAHWAPSGMNEQPWRYVVAFRDNVSGFEKMVSLLNPSNQLWAQHASALIFSYAKLSYSQNGKTNNSALHDTGMANQNLLLQALSMNIYGRLMGGFDKIKAKESFDISDDFQPVCIIALGHLGDGDYLPEALKAKELETRSRKPLKDVVFFHEPSLLEK